LNKNSFEFKSYPKREKYKIKSKKTQKFLGITALNFCGKKKQEIANNYPLLKSSIVVS